MPPLPQLCKYLQFRGQTPFSAALRCRRGRSAGSERPGATHLTKVAPAPVVFEGEPLRLCGARAGPTMQKRHTLHGATRRTREATLSSAPPGESSTRIRGAEQSAKGVEETIQASIESAMAELDSLEMPFRASAPPLTAAPPQQMPRGMPPLPFKAPHPSNMPPLPAGLRLVSTPPVSETVPEPPAPAVGSARPSRSWVFIALVLGLVCLGLALWLDLG